MPGLNGFVGEFLILSGTFLTHRWWAVVATVGVVLAAIYLLVGLSAGLPGQAAPSSPERSRDLNWREGLVLAPLVILIVLIGVFPGPCSAASGPR